MPRVFGLSVVEIRTAWGKSVDPGVLQDALRAHPEARAVYLTHSETSTGTALDIRALASVVRENSEALVCVDGISSVGALELRTDEWGVDVCVTGSQKGLMIPPGLAFVSLGGRAAAAVGRSRMPKFYFDLGRALIARERGDTPWTPAISLVLGADAALGMIRREGIENLWARHRRLAHGLRAGIAALGLSLFSDSPSDSVTAVCLPAGVGWKEFSAALKTGSGVTASGGQGDFAGKIFRLGHLGYFDEFDIVGVVSAVERALARCGYPFGAGEGVRAVQQSFLS
jgi:aspartate aminotransferase-like enzyme